MGQVSMKSGIHLTHHTLACRICIHVHTYKLLDVWKLIEVNHITESTLYVVNIIFISESSLT